ncbi:hypothetical protein [Krasilnikovia sp. MM14-A1004]|uniref:hypothetical protein n=1 Tax=Krasilnikovia sp. MM14-A1004 TaxID=3373541 RepID=UPI00399D54D7
MQNAQKFTATRRLIRATTTVVALAAAATGTAFAATASPAAAAARGWSTVESCTSAAGSVSYQPGLTSTVRPETGVLSATLAGCASTYTGGSPGTGLLTAFLSGSSSSAVVSQRGSFTINWPAASGLNPSNGTLSLTGPDATGRYTASGSVTSGAYTGGSVGTTFVVIGATGDGSAAHPVTLQQVTNTAPLLLRRNTW